MRRALYHLLIGALLVAIPAGAAEVRVAPGQIEVTDGNTIRLDGKPVRLVGFDAPETYRAKCPSEREMGNRATFRLRQLVAAGGLTIEMIPCSCRPGTEGTPACNYARACGVLRAAGRDIADIMIKEALARPFICGPTRCPPREGWCDPNRSNQIYRRIQRGVSCSLHCAVCGQRGPAVRSAV